MKKSPKVKAAWITGACVITAAIIGRLKCRDGTRTEQTVTSHGQSGGITAHSVTAGNITIYNYFDKQNPDEKRALEQNLKKKYPLGYAVFATDGTNIHVPCSLSFERDFVVRWGDERVLGLTADTVIVLLPDILYKGPGPTILEDCTAGVERKVGSIQRFVFGRSVVIVEILKDEGDFVVVALGFREFNESDRVPSGSGL